jgi:hypothetical protein
MTFAILLKSSLAGSGYSLAGSFCEILWPIGKQGTPMGRPELILGDLVKNLVIKPNMSYPLFHLNNEMAIFLAKEKRLSFFVSAQVFMGWI